MEEAASESRYWCHVCEQTVNPIIMEHHQLDINCPFCQSGFVEQMTSDEATLPDDGGSDRAFSLWAPILLGMMGNPSRRRRGRRLRHEDDDEAEDGEGESEWRRHRSSATILHLLQGIRAGLASETEERAILLNPFDQQTESVEGDYLMGPGLDLLLQHLAENDPNPSSHGTPPACKEAVEGLPTVVVNQTLQCSVCLDDFDHGCPAKQMPCNHKFHADCILPWLELHSSCPVCRFQLPADDDDDGDCRRFSLPLPFSGFFAQSNGSVTNNNDGGTA